MPLYVILPIFQSMRVVGLCMESLYLKMKAILFENEANVKSGEPHYWLFLNTPSWMSNIK